MLRWHRLCALLAFPFVLYVIATGAGIQMWDMIALVGHAPDTDRNMLMMRQHNFGTPNYAVLSAPDFSAPALSASTDFVADLQKTAALGRAAAPGQAMKLVEVRGVPGVGGGNRVLAGHVQMGPRHLIFDLATGKPLPAADLPPPEPGRDFSSPRSDFKAAHRLAFWGPPVYELNLFVGLALAVMIFTGLKHYWKLWRARARMDRNSPYWKGGTKWRALHRWVAITAMLPVIWITLSGLVLTIDDFEPVVVGWVAHPPRDPKGFDGDLSTPMSDAEIAPMARATLAAYAADKPGSGIKVLRMRYFSGYAQGVVIAADGASSQNVYNTKTGAKMSMTEPGYPNMGFPSGWEWHQQLKKIHRGDIFGMTGRWLDSIGAICLLYLIISGGVMYWQMWRRRAQGGRKALIWK